jgi:hypothetical protein
MCVEFLIDMSALTESSHVLYFILEICLLHMENKHGINVEVDFLL